MMYKCKKCNGTGGADDESGMARELAYNDFEEDDEFKDANEYADKHWIDYVYTLDELNHYCDICHGTGEVDWITNCMNNSITHPISLK